MSQQWGRVSHSSGASEATVDVCIMCLCVCVCLPFLIFFYVLNYLLFYFFLQDAFVNVNRGLNGVFFAVDKLSCSEEFLMQF